jgi:hypothetical protein
VVNHALAGIPEEKVRYHLCWGSWHGPHTHDLPLDHIVDLIFEVKAQTYSFEAANVRHEHEWRVWQEAKLPAGKMLMPGVVSHATNLVEHPQLIADRILRYAAIVSREDVAAGSTPTSPGPSCARSSKAPTLPRRASGLSRAASPSPGTPKQNSSNTLRQRLACSRGSPTAVPFMGYGGHPPRKSEGSVPLSSATCTKGAACSWL